MFPMEMKNRLQELDFSKGILILLMVMFHLGYFNSCYPNLTNCVYAFHMSGFLVISGYLCSVETSQCGVSTLKRILVPYIVFEFFYLSGLSLVGKYVGASNVFEGDALSILLQIATKPVGTYWYLHTLVFCLLTFHILNYFGVKGKANICLSSILLYLMSLGIEGLLWYNVLYFVIGISCRILSFQITDRLKSVVMGIGFVAILIFADDVSRYSLVGVGLTLTFLGFLFAIMEKTPVLVKSFFSYIGRNSLAIVLFSPVFMIITKVYYPLFVFDSTVILWMIFSLVLVCSLCLVSAALFDKLKISNVLIGKNMYSPFLRIN